MTSLVVVSDLHGDRETLGHSRFPEVRTALDSAVDYAIDTEAQAFLCLGDISDPDTGGAAYNAMGMVIRAALRLAKARIPSIWIAGNHDVWEDGTGATCLSPLAAIASEMDTEDPETMIYVAEIPRVVDLGETLSVLCLPYTPVSHNYDPRAYAKNTFASQKKRARIITAGHLMIEGVVQGEETTEMPRGRDVAFPIEETSGSVLRLAGHYHHRQTTKEGIIIPGSLCRFSFGDEKHEPGFLHIEV